MASSSSGTVAQKTDETKDCQEYDFRGQLLVGEMESKFRKRFHKNFSKDPNKLCNELKNHEAEINKLLNKKVIKRDQYNLLLPTNVSTVDSDDFDVFY